MPPLPLPRLRSSTSSRCVWYVGLTSCNVRTVSWQQCPCGRRGELVTFCRSHLQFCRCWARSSTAAGLDGWGPRELLRLQLVWRSPWGAFQTHTVMCVMQMKSIPLDTVDRVLSDNFPGWLGLKTWFRKVYFGCHAGVR